MKRRDFTIPIYDVDVTFLQVEHQTIKEQKLFKRSLRELNIPQKDIDEEIEYMQDSINNGATTYSSLVSRKIVVLFHIQTSTERLIEAYAHEKRHVEDKILEFFEIHDSESAALLAGYLGVELYKFYLQEK